MKTALVTGASSGIGLDLCRLLSKDGYQLVMVARDADKLKQAAAAFPGSRAIAADLADAAAPASIFDQVSEVDILINNAGYTVYGEFSETDTKRELDMIAVNVTALTHLSKLYLPGMKQRRSGRIMNVASTAAFLPGPLMAVYYATKAYVLSFSEALAAELEGSGVTVTCLCPGPTHTGFVARGQVEASKLFKTQHVMKSERVARIGYRALMRGQPLVIAGLRNQIMTVGLRVAPRSIVPRFVRKAQEAGEP